MIQDGHHKQLFKKFNVSLDVTLEFWEAAFCWVLSFPLCQGVCLEFDIMFDPYHGDYVTVGVTTGGAVVA